MESFGSALLNPIGPVLQVAGRKTPELLKSVGMLLIRTSRIDTFPVNHKGLFMYGFTL